MQNLHKIAEAKANDKINLATKEFMSVIENLGNTKTIRIGEASDREVDNYSRKIAVVHNGKTIPILGDPNAYDSEGIHEISGANEITAVDAEVKDGDIYLLGRSTHPSRQNFYWITRHDLKSGVRTGTWDSKSFSFVSEEETPYITIFEDNWSEYEGTPYAHFKDDFKQFRKEFSFLSIPEHGTGSISSSTSEPSSSEDDIFEISSPSKFKVKNIDKITNFNPSTDTLEIDTESFGIDSSSTFAAGTNKRDIKKNLAKQDVDFLYDQKKGGLYFNENGADNGFGEGGIIAILKGAPDLTSGNLEFI